jgi:hypothetical protein
MTKIKTEESYGVDRPWNKTKIKTEPFLKPSRRRHTICSTACYLHFFSLGSALLLRLFLSFCLGLLVLLIGLHFGLQKPIPLGCIHANPFSTRE